MLTAAVREAEAVRDRAHAAHQQASARAARLEELGRDLERELAAWEPIRSEHSLVTDLAALVEGKSVDNLLKMRLSAYVLSERLRQVVAAANERLGEMTDERYTLEQADEKGAGEQRGGLSLRVRDEWSGKQRDPATLSGGETFLVSLALALGLADTVSHEAGGIQLETLFIDEGFGALDATTLDAVMDTLDSLRDGGRVVGLVSHVHRAAQPGPRPARGPQGAPGLHALRLAGDRLVVRVIRMPSEIDPTFLALPYERLAQAALARARDFGVSHADFRFERNRYQFFSVRDGVLEGAQDSEDLGFAVRVILDGAWGFRLRGGADGVRGRDRGGDRRDGGPGRGEDDPTSRGARSRAGPQGRHLGLVVRREPARRTPCGQDRTVRGAGRAS